MDFRTFLQQNIAVFDGAFGTMVQKSGARVGTVPEEINLTQPQLAADIHRAYAAAGADVITADTFGANEKKVGSAKRAEELIEAGVRLAKEAAPGKFIALDIGPIGMLLEPMGTLSFEEAYQIFARLHRAGGGRPRAHRDDGGPAGAAGGAAGGARAQRTARAVFDDL